MLESVDARKEKRVNIATHPGKPPQADQGETADVGPFDDPIPAEGSAPKDGDPPQALDVDLTEEQLMWLGRS